MISGRFVDLSHKLYPGKEEYHLELVTHFTDELYPQYKRDPNVWYILQDIKMSSHCGTHIEFPYHHNSQGLDAGSFPLSRLIGDGVLLNFRQKQPNEAVTLDEIKEHDADLREGDLVLFDFNCAHRYRTPDSHVRPMISHEAIRWLALEKKVGLVGSDASGIEIKGAPNQPNHQLLMDNQIPIIECATNLDQLTQKRFTLLVLSLCVVGLDACPVRLVAIETGPGH